MKSLNSLENSVSFSCKLDKAPMQLSSAICRLTCSLTAQWWNLLKGVLRLSSYLWRSRRNLECRLTMTPHRLLSVNLKWLNIKIIHSYMLKQWLLTKLFQSFIYSAISAFIMLYCSLPFIYFTGCSTWGTQFSQNLKSGDQPRLLTKILLCCNSVNSGLTGWWIQLSQHDATEQCVRASVCLFVSLSVCSQDSYVTAHLKVSGKQPPECSAQIPQITDQW